MGYEKKFQALFDKCVVVEMGCVVRLGEHKYRPTLLLNVAGKMRSVAAAVAALRIRLGRPLKADAQACHLCDNGHCINSFHLYEGNSITNALDRRWARMMCEPVRGMGYSVE